MSKAIPIFKDFFISAIIAVLTANLFELPNLIFQVVITLLVLIILFLILRGLDKLARRLEILSVLYCENFIVPFLKTISDNNSLQDEDNLDISKIKIFVIQPSAQEDILKIQEQLHQLQRYSFKSKHTARGFYVQGKPVEQNLVVFDTPLAWHLGIENLIISKKLKPKQIKVLLEKMSADIKKYSKKQLPEEHQQRLEFIDISQFNKFFN